MLSKRKATIHSRNGSSKTRKFNPVHKWTVDNDSFLKKVVLVCREDEFIFRLFEIFIHFAHNVDTSSNEFDNIAKRIKSFTRMLGFRCKFYYDSCMAIHHQADSKEDSNSFCQSALGHLLGMLAGFKVNLEYAEKQHSKLIGLNKYLSDKFPEIYNAYCKMSKRHGFTNPVEVSDENLFRESKKILDAICGNNSTGDYDLLELDEKLQIENICETANSTSVNESSGTKNSIFNDMTEENFFLYTMLFVCLSIVHKIKDERNESHQIDDILSSFSNLIGSRCKYFLDSDGAIGYKLSDDKEFVDSSESALLIFLGVFACYRINLDFFEKQNPDLEGLNEHLKKEYPEAYNAYWELTRMFGFDSMVDMGFHPEKSQEEMCTHLRNLKVEKWNGTIPKNDDSISKEKVNTSICKDGLKESDVVNLTLKKPGNKNPLKKRKSLHRKHRTKAKRFIHINRRFNHKTVVNFV
jgi:hypothetical protein